MEMGESRDRLEMPCSLNSYSCSNQQNSVCNGNHDRQKVVRSRREKTGDPLVQVARLFGCDQRRRRRTDHLARGKDAVGSYGINVSFALSNDATFPFEWLWSGNIPACYGRDDQRSSSLAITSLTAASKRPHTVRISPPASFGWR
jgi:hypothetical protein